MPAKEKPLSPNEALFRDAFDWALTTAGRDLEIENGETVRAVDLDQLRAEFYRRHGSDNEDTRRKAFERVSRMDGYRHLITEGTAMIWRVESP